MSSYPVRKISRSPEFFHPYGRIIDLPRKGAPGSENLFRIILRQRQGGWRIAYLVVRDKLIDRLEQHPGSWESFEPVRGQVLLFVANRRRTRDIRCFLLDKPVVLKKGVWHGVVTITPEADIKITENACVTCVYWKTGIRMGLSWGTKPLTRPI